MKLVMKNKVVELDPNDAINILEASDLDEDDKESGVIRRRENEISTKRQPADVGKLPKELIRELEDKSKSSSTMNENGKRQFPGDGSEIVVGG